jgi:hypothetical protein
MIPSNEFELKFENKIKMTKLLKKIDELHYCIITKIDF